MDACGKFGEHERSVRVARGAAESNSSFLSALKTSQVKTLDLVSKIGNDKFASSNNENVRKKSKNTQRKCRQTKAKYSR